MSLSFTKNYELSKLKRISAHEHVEYWRVYIESMQEYIHIQYTHNTQNYKQCVKHVCVMSCNTTTHAKELKRISIKQYFEECFNMSNEQQHSAHKQLLNELCAVRMRTPKLRKYGVKQLWSK